MINIRYIRNIIEINLFNILLLLFFFNSSKVLFYDKFYVRGILVDYNLPLISLNYIIIILLSLVFLNKLQKRDFTFILLIFSFLLVNLLFSTNPLFSLIFFLKSFGFVIMLFILIKTRPLPSYKLIVILNIFYFFIFLIQFFSQESYFPYFPSGFYYFKGVQPNMDYINFFGSKIVSPPANFTHPNVFAAFISFLNIFHIKRNNYLFFVNVFVVTILGSFSALFFNILIFLFYFKKLTFSLFTKISFLLYFGLLFIYFFKYQYKSVSLIERINQLNISSWLIERFMLFGVGASNFIYNIPLYESYKMRIFVLQPVHNIFLLFLVEFGLFGIIMFLYVLYKYRYYLRFTPYFLFFLVFAFFDHFFLTNNQGILLLLLTIFMHKSIINSND